MTLCRRRSREGRGAAALTAAVATTKGIHMKIFALHTTRRRLRSLSPMQRKKISK